jgi:ATP-dependent helicase/nuclease subunit A
MLPGLARNAVIAASAGTGKTELLTSIYLARALGLSDAAPLSPSRMVATTFSRAAAREIRERLELRLSGIAGGNDADLKRALGESLAALVAARPLAMAELSRRALSALEDLPDATIDTMHNLCARLLREHGMEIGLSPAFAILEEQRALEDLEQIIDEVLSAALSGATTQAAGARQLLDAAGGLERLRGCLVPLLARLDDEGLDADELELPAESREAEQRRDELERACRELVSDRFSARAPLAQVVLSALAALHSDPLELAKAFSALAAEKKGRTAPGAAALSRLLECGRGEKNAEKALSLARLISAGAQLDQRLRGAAEVISEIQRRLRCAHLAEGALGFGDLLRLTRDALRDQPAIARAAGARIDILLVDEFQDTSRVQCELLLLLRERPERNRERRPGTLPHSGDIQPRGLVVVGDRKQSIYGFRGADVSVFAEFARELGGADAVRLLDLPDAKIRDAQQIAEVATLVNNFRSAPAILDAVNLIARRDFAPQFNRSYEIRYSEAEALRLPAERSSVERGSVQLLLDDGRTPDAEPLLRRAVGSQRLAFAIAAYCARAISSGTAAKELAILARRRATLPLLGFALDDFGVPYVVSGRDLYATAEVRDVYAALRLTQAPHDRHALAVVARSPLGGLEDQTLLELCDLKRGLLPAPEWKTERISSPEQAELVNVLQLRLAQLLQVAPRLSPRDAIDEIARRFELEAVLGLLPRGAVRLANLSRLQEIAATHGGNLAAFVRFLTRQIALEVDETEAALFSPSDDAVRLLTIHGSKGLAFPTVILADADAVEASAPPPIALLRREQGAPLFVLRHVADDGPIVTDSQNQHSADQRARAYAERQRLSYVALTRARRELVIALPVSARANTLAKTLLDLNSEGEFEHISGCSAESLSALLELPRLPTSSPPAASPPPTARRAIGDVVLGATALAHFCACPRRFSLLELHGLPEPRPFGPPFSRQAQLSNDSQGDLEADARRAGIAAHRVLELWPLEKWGEPPDVAHLAELLEHAGLAASSRRGAQTLQGLSTFLSGPYAARVRSEARAVHRELDLSVVLSGSEVAESVPRAPVSDPASSVHRGRRRGPSPAQLELFAPPLRTRVAETPSDGSPRLVLKATLDLLVELRSGELHVVDYKRTPGGPGDAARYAFQLALYRSAVLLHFGRTPQIGLLHLLGAAHEPEWLMAPELDFAALARAFAEARLADRWTGVDVGRCRKLRCGFLPTCHGESGSF